MVGETRFHRWIHKASLGRNAGKRKDSFREQGKKRAPTARTVYVSLDRADAIIEGGRPRPQDCLWVPHPFGFGLCAHSASRMTLRGKGGVFLLLFSNFQFLFSRWPLAGRALIPKKRRWGGCIL